METVRTLLNKPFLGVHFQRCKVYGRLYKNQEGDAYEGRCPRCGHRYRVAIGSSGTNKRFFDANCPDY